MTDLADLPRLLAARQWDAAERVLRRAAAHPAAPAAVAYNLAKVLEAKGAPEPRAPLYRRAVAADPRHAAAWFELGRALVAEAAGADTAPPLAQAEAAFARAAALTPTDRDAWRMLVRLRLRLGDWAGVEAALAHLPRDAETAAAAYRAAAELGRPEAPALRAALLANPAHRPEALKALTRVARGAVPLRIAPA